MSPCTRSQAVKKARKELHPTDPPHLGVALLQLTHAAPSFLASLSPDALKHLSATSCGLHKQVQASVTSISGVGAAARTSFPPSGQPSVALLQSP